MSSRTGGSDHHGVHSCCSKQGGVHPRCLTPMDRFFPRHLEQRAFEVLHDGRVGGNLEGTALRLHSFFCSYVSPQSITEVALLRARQSSSLASFIAVKRYVCDEFVYLSCSRPSLSNCSAGASFSFISRVRCPAILRSTAGSSMGCSCLGSVLRSKSKVPNRKTSRQLLPPAAVFTVRQPLVKGTARRA